MARFAGLAVFVVGGVAVLTDQVEWGLVTAMAGLGTMLAGELGRPAVEDLVSRSVLDRPQQEVSEG